MMLQAGASVASHNLVLPGYKVEVSSLGQGFAKRLQNLRDTFEQNHLSLQARGLTVHAAIHALAHGCIFATKLCHRLSILDSPHIRKSETFEHVSPTPPEAQYEEQVEQLKIDLELRRKVWNFGLSRAAVEELGMQRQVEIHEIEERKNQSGRQDQKRRTSWLTV